MANQKVIELFAGAKTRVFSVVVGVVVVAGVAGYSFYHHRENAALEGSAEFSDAPNIHALPGVGNPSQSYVKSVVYQNTQNAAQAIKNGDSNVPTLTRASFLGNPEDFMNAGTDMSSHSCQKPMVDPNACTKEALMNARQSGVRADELKCKGCLCPSMKSAGFTAGELKKAGFDASGLKACGFTAAELKAAGFSAAELKDAGFTAKELAAAGFTPGELKAAGFSDKDIQDAGFSPAQLLAAGIGVKNTSPDCSAIALKRAHDSGVSAQSLKDCGAAALKAAGYSAKDLADAGFSAADLAAAGFAPAELKKAGFSADNLKTVGLSAGQLKDAGFSANDLAQAGFNPDALRAAGYTAGDLRQAGFLPAQLKQVGFTSGDLIRAGFSPDQAGYANNVDNAVNQNLASASAPNNPGIPNIMADTMQGRLAAIQHIQEQQLAAQQRQQALNDEEANMAQQAKQLQSQWSNIALQQYQQLKQPKVNAADQSGNGGNTAQNAVTNGSIIKAGTVMFAVLDTGVDTDSANTPILARIITGPLKGTKLMGQFTRVDTKVALQFNLANVPGLPNSLSLNGVAIDQNTAQTAVSGQVDNHYLLRYGSLFASAFVSGMSNAIQSTNGSTLVGPGFIWTSHGPLNTAQQVAAGLGNVGQQYAQNMSQNFNRAPTVKIPGGTGIGVLLMSDLQLPSNFKNTTN